MDTRTYFTTVARAEQLFLSACLQWPKIMAEYADVPIERFQSRNNQDIWDAIRQIHARGNLVNYLSVCTELEKTGKLASCGGDAYLTGLLNMAIAPEHTKDAFTQITDAWKRREIKTILQSSIRNIDDLDSSPDSVLDSTQHVLAGIRELAYGSPVEHVRDVFDRVHRHVTSTLRGDKSVVGIPSGIDWLDKHILGLVPGTLLLIGGKPESGKSQIGAQLAWHAALHENANVLLCSGEMPAEHVLMRMLAAHLHVNLMQPDAEEQPEEHLEQIRALAADCNIWFSSPQQGLSIESIYTYAKYLALKDCKPDIVIVDYLQLMPSPRGMGQAGKNVQVEENANRLKGQIATEMNCCVICISALSRQQQDGRQSKPTSGRIKYAADYPADTILQLVRDYDLIAPSTYMHITKARLVPGGHPEPLRLQWYRDEHKLRSYEEGQTQGPRPKPVKPVIDDSDDFLSDII